METLDFTIPLLCPILWWLLLFLFYIISRCTTPPLKNYMYMPHASLLFRNSSFSYPFYISLLQCWHLVTNNFLPIPLLPIHTVTGFRHESNRSGDLYLKVKGMHVNLWKLNNITGVFAVKCKITPCVVFVLRLVLLLYNKIIHLPYLNQ